MRRFIFRLFLFTLVLWIGDRFTVRVLEYFRPVDYRLFIDAKSEFFDANRSYDLVIIGDSHISDALNSRIIDFRLNLRSFNLGVYHASPYEWYNLLKASIASKERPPKYIVIGVNPDMFFRELRAGKYTPVIIDNVLAEYGLYKNSNDGIDASFFVQSVEQRDLFLSMWHQILGKKYVPTRQIRDVYSGYLETRNSKKLRNWSSYKVAHKEIVSDQIIYFEKLLSLAVKHDIKIFIVNSPIWKDLQVSRNSNSDFKDTQIIVGELSRKYNVEIFNDNYNYGIDELSKEDFLDPEHLNCKGAKKFTGKFCEWFLAHEGQQL